MTVANANLSDGGYIAILDENGSVVGATDYLDSGPQENVTVPLLEPLSENESVNLTAQAHLDTNDNQTLDFLTSNGTEDGPYTVNGTPVTDDAVVTVGEEPTTEEPTTTDEPETTTTDEPETTTADDETTTTDEPETTTTDNETTTTDEPETTTTDDETTTADDETTTTDDDTETAPPTETPVHNETES
ncbi:hypothetical protein C458_10830 [Haloferax sp. ATCC BAA-644]|uniref:DUF7282 domain-containing protein n=1 Tax=Haloferax sp. ATCC BAA-644 TaxID=1227462 RepID=UPI0002AFED4C|nr:hypothetical protein [Haloferax sp. ATCC BAA-644]ELZ67850.1 hypothetical protein C458_10830 [Haloferax sp. ATCC BAA-644]